MQNLKNCHKLNYDKIPVRLPYHIRLCRLSKSVLTEKYIQNQILYTREDETRELKKLPCLLYKLLYFVELDSPGKVSLV